MAELEAFKAQAKLEEQNKALVKRVIEEINNGNIGIYQEAYATDYRHYSPSRIAEPLSREDQIKFMESVLEAAPDSRYSIEDVIAEGNKVAGRLNYKGTQEGEYQGIPATGNVIETSIMLISRIEDGRIVEEWEEYDQLGSMQQLGMELRTKVESAIVPPPLQMK